MKNNFTKFRLLTKIFWLYYRTYKDLYDDSGDVNRFFDEVIRKFYKWQGTKYRLVDIQCETQLRLPSLVFTLDWFWDRVFLVNYTSKQNKLKYRPSLWRIVKL